MNPAVLTPPTGADAPARPRVAADGIDIRDLPAEESIPRTAGELARRLGVSPDRVRLSPPPGTATMDDAVRLNERGEGVFELVDGTLVEKAVGFGESVLAGNLQTAFNNHIRRQKTAAIVAGEAGFARAGRDRDLMRMPDVGVFLMSGFPAGTTVSDIKVSGHPADLAVEVLSEGNTAEEMTRKRGEYFAGGTRLVWVADHRKRTVEVWTSPTDMQLVRDGEALDGGDVLPGLRVDVSDWFDGLGEPAAGPETTEGDDR